MSIMNTEYREEHRDDYDRPPTHYLYVDYECVEELFWDEEDCIGYLYSQLDNPDYADAYQFDLLNANLDVVHFTTREKIL